MVKGKAQDLVYDGWDLYSHDPRGAKECFEEALELDPDLADAYNGLAGLAADKERFEEAEALYRTAYEKAKAALGTEDPKAFAWWGELETRPYMRARCGLGLLLMQMGRTREAVAEFKDLLRLNPNDNQGIRYLVAPSASSIGTNVIIRTIARIRTFSSIGGWPYSWRGGSRSRPPGSAT